ncbi:hypothetical protein BJ944DRAFT_249314 [Cunninghamella echinulata]|nr:hypothetical protein BJ944DRAFT_249314 [Cunninghamella echinulata]
MMNGYDPSLQTQQRHQDIENVRRDYRSALADLTFNSKPIITGLTIKAQENQFAANAIVREIEQQLRNNAPGQKLPILYLIDSICKNVGGPYPSNFARNIVALFLDTYNLVDLNTRRSSERLLQTWKNGMPNGTPVFSRHLIESMERSIQYIQHSQFPGQKQPPLPQQQPPPHHHQPQPMANPSPSMHINPNFTAKARDPRNRSKVESNTPPIPPNQVYSTPPLQQTLSPQPPPQSIQTPDNINQLLGQLMTSLPNTQMNQIHYMAPTQVPPSSMPTSTPLQHLSHPPTIAPLPTANNIMTSPSTTSTAATSSSTNTTSVNPTELLQTLMSKGYLSPSVNNTPTPPPIPQPSPPQPTTIADLNIKLDSKDLQKERPGAVEFLYSKLPLKCKQCGIRHPDTKEGKAKMDAHLDSHFRQNRRMKERVKRGLSRSWFVSENDWIHGAEGELTSHQMPTFMTDKQQQQQQQDENGSTLGLSKSTIDDTMEHHQKDSRFLDDQLNNHKKLEDYTVIMPPDDNDRKPCPICGERFVDVWNNDEEEWILVG